MFSFLFFAFSANESEGGEREREKLSVSWPLVCDHRREFPAPRRPRDAQTDQDEERVCVVSVVRLHAAHAGSVAALRRHPMAVSVSEFLSN